MSAKYWVRVAEELLRDMDPSLLPDGLRLADTGVTTRTWAGHLEVLFEDDNAPSGLEGKQVELILGRRGREGAKAVIIERRALS